MPPWDAAAVATGRFARAASVNATECAPCQTRRTVSAVYALGGRGFGVGGHFAGH